MKCGVHLRGTFLTGHGASYVRWVGNTLILNCPCYNYYVDLYSNNRLKNVYIPWSIHEFKQAVTFLFNFKYLLYISAV